MRLISLLIDTFAGVVVLVGLAVWDCSALWEKSQTYPLAACCNLGLAIHIQACHSTPSCGCLSCDLVGFHIDFKVLIPEILAGIEKADRHLCYRVNSLDLHSFEQIA